MFSKRSKQPVFRVFFSAKVCIGGATAFVVFPNFHSTKTWNMSSIPCKTNRKRRKNIQRNFNITKGQETCYNGVSLYRGSFPYNFLFLGPRISFVIPTTSIVV